MIFLPLAGASFKLVPTLYKGTSLKLAPARATFNLINSIKKKIVYLDLNIFDRLEKLPLLNSEEQDKYSFLNQKIINEEIKVPYSNAHLNDLFRGFQKNPNFIDGHLNNIELLTKNLCICQYWGKNEVTWHNRSIRAFFEEKKSDLEFEPNSFSVLFQDEVILTF